MNTGFHFLNRNSFLAFMTKALSKQMISSQAHGTKSNVYNANMILKCIFLKK